MASVLAMLCLLWRANNLTSMINFVSYSTLIHWKLLPSLTQFSLQELENTIQRVFCMYSILVWCGEVRRRHKVMENEEREGGSCVG